MARKKMMNMEPILSDNARKASFKKRHAALVKKLRELAILCDAHFVVIIYCPERDSCPTPMVVWPSVEREREVVGRFQSSESYLEERVAKLEEMIERETKKKMALQAWQILDQARHRGFQSCVNELNEEELHSLEWFLEMKNEEILKEIERRKNECPDEVGTGQGQGQGHGQGGGGSGTDNNTAEFEEWLMSMEGILDYNTTTITTVNNNTVAPPPVLARVVVDNTTNMMRIPPPHIMMNNYPPPAEMTLPDAVKTGMPSSTSSSRFSNN